MVCDATHHWETPQTDVLLLLIQSKRVLGHDLVIFLVLWRSKCIFCTWKSQKCGMQCFLVFWSVAFCKSKLTIMDQPSKLIMDHSTIQTHLCQNPWSPFNHPNWSPESLVDTDSHNQEGPQRCLAPWPPEWLCALAPEHKRLWIFRANAQQTHHHLLAVTGNRCLE